MAKSKPAENPTNNGSLYGKVGEHPPRPAVHTYHIQVDKSSEQGCFGLLGCGHVAPLGWPLMSCRSTSASSSAQSRPTTTKQHDGPIQRIAAPHIHAFHAFTPVLRPIRVTTAVIRLTLVAGSLPKLSGHPLRGSVLTCDQAIRVPMAVGGAIKPTSSNIPDGTGPGAIGTCANVSNGCEGSCWGQCLGRHAFFFFLSTACSSCSSSAADSCWASVKRRK